MVIKSILGHLVFLDSRQERALLFAERVSKELAAERRLQDEQKLQNHLHFMEEHSRENQNSTVRKMREAARLRYLASCAPKHHAWEYTEFTFCHEGKEYSYNNGDITDLSEVEEMIL